MAKTINAVFTSGVFTRTAKVFQWDSGDKLAFVNVDLPNSYQVHFANSLTGASKTVLGDSTGVAIPPEYFVPGSEIYAWVWLSTENGGYTKYQVTIPIYRRAQPQNVTPTPAQIDALDEAINTINAAIESGIITPEEKQKLAGIEAGAQVNDIEHIYAIDPTSGEDGELLINNKSVMLPDYRETAVLDFTLTSDDYSDLYHSSYGVSGPLWSAVETACENFKLVTAKVALAGGNEEVIYCTRTEYLDDPFYVAFVGTTDIGEEIRICNGETLNSWFIDISKYGEDIETLAGWIGDLDSLTTTEKDNLVAAINEAAASGGGSSNSIWTTSETPINAGTKYVFTTSQLSGPDTSPSIGDLIVASSADVYQINKVNSSTVEAAFVENIKGATGANGQNGTNGTSGANGNAIWTTSETPLNAGSNYVFTTSLLSGRSTPTPAVGDLIVASSADVYQIGTVNSSTVEAAFLGSIKGATGPSGLSVIPSGSLDSTSTATAMTATITGITALSDGVCVWLSNGVISSASGVTLNVNGLGAKPIYNSLTGAVVTTTFTAASTYLFVYNSTRVTGGCWDMVYGYDTNTTYTPVKLGFGYTTCDTAAATAAKTAALSSYTLTANGIVSVKFTNAVGAGATLNINSKGAKAIYYKGSAITAGVIKAGDTATFIYSTYYHLISIDRQPTAADVGAIAAPSSPTTGDFLCWNGSAWAATSLSAWQGGNY